MMKRGVPVAYRRVVPPTGQLQLVRKIVPQDRALDLRQKTGGSRRQRNLAEKCETVGELRDDVPRQLTLEKALRHARSLRRVVVEVGESEHLSAAGGKRI